MNSQTTRRPEQKRPARSSTSGLKSYRKQTAHVSMRRDGKPLIFGWGGHLSHYEKNQLQRRATFALVALIGLVILAVIVGFFVNINIITPNLPITNVNGQSIPQIQYRKMVAVQTQFALNQLYGPNGYSAIQAELSKQTTTQQTAVTTAQKKVTDLTGQIKATTDATKKADLTKQLTAAQTDLKNQQQKLAGLSQESQTLTSSTIPYAQQNFTQSQIGNESATWLQDDVLISQWAAKQSGSIQAKINPTDKQVNDTLNTFKKNLPKVGSHATTYDKYLSKDGISNDDVVAMMTITQRRVNAQNYLATQVVSPTRQIHARSMTIATQADANTVLQKLKSGGDFAALAKSKSVDNSTNTKGGDLGWIARGQYLQTDQSAIVEDWLFDSARHVNELSPVIKENGAFRIVQVLGIDPSRVVDANTLSTLKSNALQNWLTIQRAQPGVNISDIDQNKLLDPGNLPSDLPAGAPSEESGASGLPSGLPGQ